MASTPNTPTPPTPPAAPGPVTHTEGSHTAVALEYHEFDHAPGAIFVVAACCGRIGDMITCPVCNGRVTCPTCSGKGKTAAGSCPDCLGIGTVPGGCQNCQFTGRIKDEDTRQWGSIYDVATMSPVDIQAEIQSHVTRAAKHHAGVDLARGQLAALTQNGRAKRG